MLAFELIAERKIEEALARGEFDGLPGEGRPLDLDDDALVPEELRMAYRILKNAGFAPQEVQAQGKGERKLSLISARVEARYFRRAVRKLGG
jgi:DnaJ homologue, subfamily C, member 28, conserved domain